MPEGIDAVLAVLWNAHAVTYLFQSAVYVCAETIGCGISRMEVEQVFIISLCLVLAEERFNDRRHSHFHIGLVCPELFCLGAEVMYYAVVVVCLLEVVEVSRVYSSETKHHLHDILCKFWQGRDEFAFRQGSGEEFPALFRGDRKFLRWVALRDFHLKPRVELDSDQIVFLVVQFLVCGLEYLPDADGVHFLCSLRVLKGFYPLVEKNGCERREHDLCCAGIEFEAFNRMAVVL